mmetsp:Transcript_43892/g.85863  ORF Transcript_43892/g.85863 Transcript_43892/m.85863 type:complete len:253 (+) Transcript_43892:156-914(+)
MLVIINLIQSSIRSSNKIYTCKFRDVLNYILARKLGLRFSRNDLSPSCPSSETRIAAISPETYSLDSEIFMVQTSSMSSFALDMACGELRQNDFTRAATPASNSSIVPNDSEHNPIFCAVWPLKRSPVRKYREQLTLLIFSMTKGLMTAGRRPIPTSVKPMTAESTQRAMSQADTRPAPPPKAAPFTRATVGTLQNLIAATISKSLRASSLFSSSEYCAILAIQLISAPAENEGPSPVRTTQRGLSACLSIS